MRNKKQNQYVKTAISSLAPKLLWHTVMIVIAKVISEPEKIIRNGLVKEGIQSWTSSLFSALKQATMFALLDMNPIGFSLTACPIECVST